MLDVKFVTGKRDYIGKMAYNHREALEHLYKVRMLNIKGLKEFIRLLKKESLDLKLEIMDLESKLQYKKIR